MFEDDSYYMPVLSDCIHLATETLKSAESKTTEFLIDYLIDIEMRKGIKLPENVAKAIDNFYESPKMSHKNRQALVGFVVLIECDLMVSEQGEIKKTVIR